MRKIHLAAIGLFLSLLYIGCSKKTTPADNGTVSGLNLPSVDYDYAPALPAHIQSALAGNDNTPVFNPITNAGATLGRVLFYDKLLSRNNTVNCASCHKLDYSFTDDKMLSPGFAGQPTVRHSMGLMNVRFYRSGKMFWDERSPSLEHQVLQPVQNMVEMGMTIPEVVDRVKGASYYPELFRKAFGSSLIDSVHISYALAQFVRSMVTTQAKYDLVKEGRATFTPAEAAGEQLFLTAGGPNACASCHKPPMFLSSEPSAPFGLPDPADQGINNSGNFKSRSLRNIAVSGPYFHNGSISSLAAILTSTIPKHRVAPQDVQNLIAFMNTLTDNSLQTDPRFANPFR